MKLVHESAEGSESVQGSEPTDASETADGVERTDASEAENGSGAVLADDVEVADTFLRKALGLMGRSSVPEGYALVFEFGSPRTHGIHMVGVRTPIDVVWLVDGEVRRVETLGAWTGFARARADTVIELPPGAAAEVSEGDAIRIVE